MKEKERSWKIIKCVVKVNTKRQQTQFDSRHLAKPGKAWADCAELPRIPH